MFPIAEHSFTLAFGLSLSRNAKKKKKKPNKNIISPARAPLGQTTGKKKKRTEDPEKRLRLQVRSRRPGLDFRKIRAGKQIPSNAQRSVWVNKQIWLVRLVSGTGILGDAGGGF